MKLCIPMCLQVIDENNLLLGVFLQIVLIYKNKIIKISATNYTNLVRCNYFSNLTCRLRMKRCKAQNK